MTEDTKYQLWALTHDRLNNNNTYFKYEIKIRSFSVKSTKYGIKTAILVLLAVLTVQVTVNTQLLEQV